MINFRDGIKVVDRIEHLYKGVSEGEFSALFSGEESELILESCSLEDIENTYLYDYLLPQEFMFEAITAKYSKLKNRMVAFTRSLRQYLKATGISVGDVELGKPRKAGDIALVAVRFPLSDGQAISVVFHAPDNDPSKVTPDDTLIAFRFMLNSRDITHVVAPSAGKDISMKQASVALANVVERNTTKFQAAQAEKARLKQELETLESNADIAEAQVVELTNQIESVHKELADQKDNNEKLQGRIDNQDRIQEDLKAQITELQGNVKNAGSVQVVGIGGISAVPLSQVTTNSLLNPAIKASATNGDDAIWYMQGNPADQLAYLRGLDSEEEIDRKTQIKKVFEAIKAHGFKEQRFRHSRLQGIYVFVHQHANLVLTKKGYQQFVDQVEASEHEPEQQDPALDTPLEQEPEAQPDSKQPVITDDMTQTEKNVILNEGYKKRGDIVYIGEGKFIIDSVTDNGIVIYDKEFDDKPFIDNETLEMNGIKLERDKPFEPKSSEETISDLETLKADLESGYLNLKEAKKRFERHSRESALTEGMTERVMAASRKSKFLSEIDDLSATLAALSAPLLDEQETDPSAKLTHELTNLDDVTKANYEALKRWTDFEPAIGKVLISFPDESSHSYTIDEPEDLWTIIDDAYEDLNAALNKLGESSLGKVLGQESETLYNASGKPVSIFTQKDTSTLYSDSPVSDTYSYRYAGGYVQGSEQERFQLYPIKRNGELTLAVTIKNDGVETEIGLISSFADLVALISEKNQYSDHRPSVDEPEASNEESEHVEALRAIRDFSGEPTLELLNQFQETLENAVSYFEQSGTLPENEPLLEAAFANLVKAQTEVKAA